MFNPDDQDSTTIQERCDTVDAKAQYAEKQLQQPDAVASGRLAVVAGLSGLARQLGALDFRSAACSIEAAMQSQASQNAAFAISAALLDVAEAQTVPLLANLPALTVPARNTEFGGGAASLSSLSDTEDPALPAARKAILETIASLKAFTADGTQFAANSSAAKFLTAFLQSPPVNENVVEDAVDTAFRSTQG